MMMTHVILTVLWASSSGAADSTAGERWTRPKAHLLDMSPIAVGFRDLNDISWGDDARATEHMTRLNTPFVISIGNGATAGASGPFSARCVESPREWHDACTVCPTERPERPRVRPRRTDPRTSQLFLETVQ